MSRKDDYKQSEQKVGDESKGIVHGDEFDNAVTTEISDVLARAFDNDQTGDPGGVHVTEVHLAAHVEASNDDALAPGFLLNNRFEIVELMHSGGMSHVYKAIDRRRHPEGSGEVHVAIKMMRLSIASKEKARLALEREAAKAQTLSHPNIINIFDFDEHDDRFFLVMEWLEGESINALLRRTSGQRLSSNVAWPLIEGAAAGVLHAHQNNIVHADINPSNIFITQTQDIKLLDFGVARYTGDSDDSEDDGFAWVTQTYASPEVLSGLTPVFEDDIFSLGCVAYRLLSGKHAFDGSPSLVAKHQGFTVEPIPGLADNEWQILSRALAYNRSDRPTSVSVFVDRVANAPGSDDSAARGNSWVSSTWQAGLAAVVALVVLAGSGWLLQRVIDSDGATVVETPVSVLPTATNIPDPGMPSAADALVSAAVTALSAGKFVSPDGDNARNLFGQALTVEPDNAAALRGMRAISDEFVQRADAALSADDPVGAYDALGIALETDAGNPAVEIVARLLTVKGDSELADARLAAAADNLDLAVERLSRAERYRHIDPQAIQSIRGQIAESARLAEATKRLDAVDAPGVLSPEVESARTSNPAVIDLPSLAEEAPDAVSLDEPGSDMLSSDPEAELAADVPPITTSSEATLVAAAVPEVVANPEPNPEPNLDSSTDAAMADALLQPRSITVEGFGIEKYVAPVFPRRAQRRGITGLVNIGFNINTDGSTDTIDVLHAEPGDVFAASAAKAVSQWRFVPRDDVVRAQITLRFDLDQ